MKKFILLFSITVSAISTQASYLYWQVNCDQSALAGDGVWNQANLYVLDSSGKKVDESNPLSTLPGGGTASTMSDGVDVSVYSTPGSYSFYIELINTNTGALVGYSEKQTYAQLSDSGVIVGTALEDVPSVTPWHGGSYNAPEPTSAVLMLLGVAGLALRRKQRKSAE